MAEARIRGGLAGKILRVDLGSGKIWTEETAKYSEEWIGGRAVNSLILLNELDRRVKWFDPENLLIFGAGALVGTPAPGACRVSVETKNVFNDGKGSANVGGHLGPELKYAGFDHIAISGKSENPVYLFVSEGSAEIRDARFVWRKTTFETEDILLLLLIEDLPDVVNLKFNAGDHCLLEGVHPAGRLLDLLASAAEVQFCVCRLKERPR